MVRSEVLGASAGVRRRPGGDDSYEDWLKHAEQTDRTLTQEGMQVERVMIDVDELLVRCKFQGRLVNGAARSEYASWKLEQKHLKEKRNP